MVLHDPSGHGPKGLPDARSHLPPGDGDELQVRINGLPIWVLPLDQTDDDFVCPDPLDLSGFAGDAVNIEFYLHSVGEPNAAFVVDDIVLHEPLRVTVSACLGLFGIPHGGAGL